MRTKAENFRNASKPNFDLYVLSFICTNLPHLVQFLHVSAVLILWGLARLFLETVCSLSMPVLRFFESDHSHSVPIFDAFPGDSP